MKILVIGCNGFIGNNLFRFYKQQAVHEIYGCDIHLMDADSYIRLDETKERFEKIFRIMPFDICINCSGAASVPDSLKNPLLDYELNTVNVFMMLEAIRVHNPGCRFLNLSSAAVYGNPLSLPVKETDNVLPVSPYGLHKLQAEQFCLSFFHNWSVATCSLRIFSAFGPGLKKQLFWDLYQKAKAGNEILLFGSGKETRDFIHIGDIVQAIDHVVRSSDFKGECINVANGEQVTIRKAAELFYKSLAIPVTIRFNQESRKGDPLYWEADISRLKALGYRQTISLEKGLTEYAKWLKGLA